MPLHLAPHDLLSCASLLKPRYHSIAILTSERADITGPRVRRLADDIIEARRREIGEMEVLIRLLDDRGSSRSAIWPSP